MAVTQSAKAIGPSPLSSFTELNGKYALGGHGSRYEVLGLVPFPLADVGYVVFDGKGKVLSSKIFENVNNVDTVLQEVGTYTPNADGSFTVVLTGMQNRTFNIFAASISPTTGIAQEASGDDVGAGSGAGDDLEVGLDITQDPPGGYVEANLAGTYSGGFAGTNAFGETTEGAEQTMVDTGGNVTGKGHESLSGSNEADTITGQDTVLADGTYTGTVTVNGNTYTIYGLMEGVLSSIGLGWVPKARMFMVGEDQGLLKSLALPVGAL